MKKIRLGLNLSILSTSLVFSGQVFAQDAAHDQSPSGEIVVTAQRRAEDPQKVPIAISVYGAAALQKSNIQTGLDLSIIEPSIQISAGNGAALVFLRGVGNALNNAGSEASVPTYVDGVYYSRLTPALFRLNNIANIEVDKGPQGTLFGRAASGGLVQIITQNPAPGSPLQLKGSFGYGTRGTYDANGYAAVSLSNNVAADLAVVYHNNRDGWGHNLFNGKPAYTDEAFALRSKLVFAIDAQTNLTLSGDYSNDINGQGVGTFGDPSVLNGAGRINGFKSGVVGRTQPLALPGFYNQNLDGQHLTRSRTWGGSLHFDHDFGFAKLVEIAAFHKTRQFLLQDNDGSTLPVNNANLRSTSRDISNELQLVSNGGGPLKWIVGTYYLNGIQAYSPILLTGSLYDGLIGVPSVVLQFFGKQKIQSYAIYSQGTYEVVPDTHLTLGARYTWDNVQATGDQEAVIPGVGTIVFPGSTVNASKHFRQFSWKGTLDHAFSDGTLAYATIARGYKPGGFNILPADPNPIKPEVNTAYEVGFKAKWFDRKLRLNASLFLYDLKNPQVQTSPTASTIAIQNAISARIKGAEVSGEVDLAKGLAVSAGVTVLDAKYLNFPNASLYSINTSPPYGLNAPVPANVSGNYMVQVPKVTFNLGANYDLELGHDNVLSFNVNYAYNDGFFWNADNLARQPAYGLLNAQVSYAFPRRDVVIRVWGSNLTKTRYYAALSEVANGVGFSAAPGAPQLFGFAVDFKY